MKALSMVALVLLIVGGLNWLLVGLFRYDLVGAIFGGQEATLARVVYTIVGICALYALTFIPRVGLLQHHHQSH